jgi:hypothetical protein
VNLFQPLKPNPDDDDGDKEIDDGGDDDGYNNDDGHDYLSRYSRRCKSRRYRARIT